MNTNDSKTNDADERSWLDRLTQMVTGTPYTRADLEGLLKLAADNEVIDEDAKTIMEGALIVGEMQARDVMIPRAQMVVIRDGATLSDVLPQIIHTGHSRYPVIGESTDDILGILLAKDLLPFVLNPDAKFDLNALLRPAVIVPESKRLNVLLREFRQARNHMAIVIDEYGGVAGLVTIEDVLEEIVGEIEDETDSDEEIQIRKLTEDSYFVQALTPVEDFNDAFDVEFSDEEFDTIGGLVLQAFGRLPARNETINFSGFEFRVINSDQRKLNSLRVTVLPEA
ncbi:MAG: magnesium/cobalt efflux protein [Alteromonadaceae bacterium]|jgi:magnesium and cobalt transporter|nr:magnesium/cobalt efflux protein [Alteromonadaceae bacterium]MBL6823184.1 CBS domain-containing protein [Luminiphilus sp.]RPH11612.1 MAG: CBS domain-containing protein [Alteromonadaceae bacterium TMED101]CAI8438152.1 MAG: Magnesium and cobalt efflux protein CorC [Halieaceae bacterium]HBQ03229.1 magnesium/cobalt efflux protein [Halieaceae bacterium]|tara:strand:- start:978 stop:1826 length:849 start_codon:yes stop_codon:yes gene_type:complete